MATDNKTSVLVNSLLPEFLDTEGPKFQAFVKAYYEWMETTGQMTDHSKNILNNQDIDQAAEEFLKYFKREVLTDFPEEILADKRLVYKKIKDLYRSKGSEESYKLLFRILYDEEVDFYYPGQDLLRASDGRWIQETSIRLTKPFRGDPDLLAGEIKGRTSGATAKVERVQNIFVDNIETYEVFVTNIEGTFLDAEEVDNTANNISGTLISRSGTLQNVIITDGGSGHQRNDLVTITSASGTGGRGTITITTGGAINKVAVTNTGSGFVRTDPLIINNTTRSAVDATAAGLLSAPIEYTGRYNDVKGFLSWSNKLQDNRYYQEYSYVLRSSQVLNTYKEIVKDVVHPAGKRLFGDVLIDVNIDNTSTFGITNQFINYQEFNLEDAIFIPQVVSASIEQYESSGDDGAIVPRPEIEIEQIETFFDIDIPDAGTGYQVEIELQAAQQSALLAADAIISAQIIFIIQDVTLNTRTANLALIQLNEVWSPTDPETDPQFANTGALWLTPNGEYLTPQTASNIQLLSDVAVGLHTFGVPDATPTLSLISVNNAIMPYSSLPIYALEDKLQDGWGLNEYSSPRTNIGTYSANTLNNSVSDFETNFPGVPSDWTVGYSPLEVSSITSTTSVPTDSTFNFEFNAFRLIGDIPVDELDDNVIDPFYTNKDFNFELTIPLINSFGDFHHFQQATGTINTVFVNDLLLANSTAIADYQDYQLQVAGTNRVIEGIGTRFDLEAEANSQVMLRYNANPATFIYNKIDTLIDSNTLILTSNVAVNVTGGDIFFTPFKVYEVLINTGINSTDIPNDALIRITNTFSFDSANTTFDSANTTFDQIEIN